MAFPGEAARGLRGDGIEGWRISSLLLAHAIITAMTLAKMQRRHFLLAAPALAVTSAHAQSWPPDRVNIIVPFPAGAATDITGRVVADKLGQMWGQAVTIDLEAQCPG